jgi:hypothetical protein
MADKKSDLTDAERAERIRETARELGTSKDPKDFERAFERVVKATPGHPISGNRRPSRKRDEGSD